MRDLRDPQKLGNALLALRKRDAKDGRERTLSRIYDSNSRSLDKVEHHDERHIGPVQKYGRPGDVQVIEEARGPVLARP